MLCLFLSWPGRFALPDFHDQRAGCATPDVYIRHSLTLCHPDRACSVKNDVGVI